MFNPGDIVVHPKFGAGTVQDIRTLDYHGTERRYFCIELVEGRGTLMIPMDRVEHTGLRLPMRDTRLIEEEMNKPPQPLVDDHRLRQAQLEKKIYSGDSRLVAQTLRDLCWRARSTKLSFTDHKLKENAFSVLLQELSLDSFLPAATIRLTIEAIIERAMQSHLAVDAG